MKRGYGSGSVFQGKDGRWTAQWEMPRQPGQPRQRRQLRADTEAAAWKRMKDAQRRGPSSSSRSRKPTGTVGAFLDRWLADVVRVTRRERTAVGYRAIANRVPAEIGALDLGSPDLGHALNAWLLSLDKHPRTVHHYAACLRAAFAYATKKGLMGRNPAVDLDLPAIPRAQRIPLTAEELRNLLDSTASQSDPLHALWTTAAWTGMRQGELLALRWQDVNLERASLVVRGSLTRLPGPKGTRYVVTEPKTERSRRTVPLVPEVVTVLRALRKAQLGVDREVDQGLVFCTAAGGPLDAGNVTRWFSAAVKRAGLPAVRFHDLRHGAATLLIQRGVDLATVSAILGHSNIATTVDVYGHLTEGHKAAAMARLAEVV